jgi:hypothetical protein
MRKERLAAAQSVADRLFAFEKAMDDAFALGSDLSSRIVLARQEAGLSAVFGQDAIDGVVRTLTALAGARREMVGTHHDLKAWADDIGLKEVGWGDLVKPPKAVLAEAGAPGEPHLRAVA